MSLPEPHVSMAHCDDARSAFSGGSNCAEAVLAALADDIGCDLPASAGSGFTEGIGHSGCVCGALAGSVMVLGAYAEQQGGEPVARRQLAERLSAEFAERFKAQWGATCCRTLKRGQTPGNGEPAAHCARITEFSAGVVAQMLREERGSAARWAGRDIMSAARRVALDGLAAFALAVIVVMLADAVGLALVAPEVVLAAGVGAGLVAAAAVELVGRLGVVGRALRAGGLAAVAAAAFVAVVLPSAVEPVIESVLSAWSGGAALFVRLAVAASVGVVAAVHAYELKRFR